MIAWQAEYQVGVRDIDDQHRKLIELINRMDEALSAGANKDALATQLTELVQYTEYHFFTEEHLMRRYAYPDLAEHREGHHHLVDQLLNLRADSAFKDKQVARQTIDFLGDWLTDHIVHVDRHLGAYLNSRGLR